MIKRRDILLVKRSKMDISYNQIFNAIFDKKVISDLRVKFEDAKTIVFGVKRSAYRTYLPKFVSPTIAYLSGAISGDGCFHYHLSQKRNYPYVRLSITSGDKEYLKLLNQFFIKSFAVGGMIHRDERKKSCYSLYVNHRVLWLYFKNYLGLDKKRLSVPKQMANRELFRFFLAGFFDTDGYYSRKAFGTMMSAKNASFLQQIREYSKKFYSYNFSPVGINHLLTKGKIFKRAYTRLSTADSKRFYQEVPLQNQKYGLARDRTANLRCFLSAGHHGMQM